METEPEPGPFRLDRPARQTVPFLFASPHSGRSYPPSLLKSTKLDATTLRRSEDAFVDELFAGVVSLGAPLLAAQFPRAFLDVNRSSTELDAGMFDAPLDMPVRRRGRRRLVPGIAGNACGWDVLEGACGVAEEDCGAADGDCVVESGDCANALDAAASISTSARQWPV